MLEVGTSIQDITPDVYGITMMGWGKSDNIVKGVFMPINARAFVFRDSISNKKIAFVCAEIAFITIAIKQGVIDNLKKYNIDLNDENVMISATHTHSAPGGFSHYIIYNLTSKGYVDEVYCTYVEGITKAIIEANNSLKSANIFLSSGEIDIKKPVAFNRSLEAYNLNPEVEKKTFENRNLAVNREMTLLKVEDENGLPYAMLNWFGVHCTNIHSDNSLIHPDNKGYAAKNFENYIKAKYSLNNFIGAFAQGSCGDVSPNFKYFPGIKYCRGKFADDYKSAEFNGNIQKEQAINLFDKAIDKLNPKIDFIHLYVDFSNVNIDPEFTDGEENISTGKAAIGVSMLSGTDEGPGVGAQLRKTLEFMSDVIYMKEKLESTVNLTARKKFIKKLNTHGNKKIFTEMADHKILGTSDIENLIIPGFADPVIEVLKNTAKQGNLGDKPWTPDILPIQIFIIGSLAIAGVPAEFTTISEQRLKDTLIKTLSKRGIKQVVLSGYSNAYSGYVTTKEEYGLQLYEGGTTHFGEWTLAAYQTKFKLIAEELLKDTNRLQSDIKPHTFSKDELAKRSFRTDSLII